jgi:hypothetical protein
VIGVISVKKRKLPRQVPLWLRRLGLVKAELKGAHFPRSAEEGLRQVAALSAANLRILRAEVRSALAGVEESRVESATYQLLARLSRADAQRVSIWKRERARCFGR